MVPVCSPTHYFNFGSTLVVYLIVGRAPSRAAGYVRAWDPGKEDGERMCEVKGEDLRKSPGWGRSPLFRCR